MEQASPYPLRLEGDLSPHLSRWLWLVKWFLAIPHFVVLFFLWIAFVGYNEATSGNWWYGSGLIGLLVCIAGIALLFAGRYPRGLYDLVMGMNRWCFRVIAYAALMTDQYPPFRLDMGDREPPTADVAATTGPAPLPAS